MRFCPASATRTNVFLLRDLWHFHFYGETPLKLVKGRERIYFEHFWNDFAADPKKSVSEADRRFYAKAFAQPGAMGAGFEVFRAFDQDAKDFAALRQDQAENADAGADRREGVRRISDPAGPLVADNVEGVVVKGSGHWLMDEARDQVVPKLVGFFSRCRSTREARTCRCSSWPGVDCPLAPDSRVASPDAVLA